LAVALNRLPDLSDILGPMNVDGRAKLAELEAFAVEALGRERSGSRFVQR